MAAGSLECALLVEAEQPRQNLIVRQQPRAIRPHSRMPQPLQARSPLPPLRVAQFERRDALGINPLTAASLGLCSTVDVRKRGL